MKEIAMTRAVLVPGPEPLIEEHVDEIVNAVSPMLDVRVPDLVIALIRAALVDGWQGAGSATLASVPQMLDAYRISEARSEGHQAHTGESAGGPSAPVPAAASQADVAGQVRGYRMLNDARSVMDTSREMMRISGHGTGSTW
jgi:hypothetical protein